MNNARFGIIVMIGIGLVILGLSAFTVNERELAIKLAVGKVVRADYEPGIHFKIPIYQTVRKFPKRILQIDDVQAQRVFTLERKSMQVDYFVKWRIIDPVQFYTSTSGSQVIAMDRLLEIAEHRIDGADRLQQTGSDLGLLGQIRP